VLLLTESATNGPLIASTLPSVQALDIAVPAPAHASYARARALARTHTTQIHRYARTHTVVRRCDASRGSSGSVLCCAQASAIPFVSVLETDDNHDGLIDSFDIQASHARTDTHTRAHKQMRARAQVGLPTGGVNRATLLLFFDYALSARANVHMTSMAYADLATPIGGGRAIIKG
jgi:hypothetical protein